MFKVTCNEKFGKRIKIFRFDNYEDFKKFYDYKKHFYYMKIAKNSTTIFTCGFFDKISYKWQEKLIVSCSNEECSNEENIIVRKIFYHIRLDYKPENIIVLGNKFLAKVNYN